MGELTIFILIYGDDIIVVSSIHDATMVVLQSLNKEFALKDLCNLNYFLRIEVNRTKDGILLTQENMQVMLSVEWVSRTASRSVLHSPQLRNFRFMKEHCLDLAMLQITEV